MKKKMILVMNFLLLFGVLIWFITAREPQGGMFPQFSARTLEKIKNTFSSTDRDILEVLSYNGRELPFDAEKGTFYLPLSMSAGEWETGSLRSGTENVEISFLTDVLELDKLELIQTGSEIPFYAFNDHEYREYSLVITGLPILEITTIEEPEETEEEGILEDAPDGVYHMRLLESDTKENWVTESDMLMHIRGNTSQTYPKKGYKFSLVKENAKGEYEANKESLLGYRKDDEWILYAIYNDGTKVRDKLSIDIWNSFGAKNNDFNGKLGTDMTYVEIIWDGAYYGLYGLMEPIDAKQVNLSGEDGVHLTEYLYKKKDPSQLNTDVFDLDDGLLVKEGFELKGKRTTATPENWQPLQDFLIWQQQESDELFASEASEYVDMDNAVDMWIFTNLITGFDQIAKNVYYVAKNVGGEYRMYFAPWDMDLTWGYSSDPEYPLSTKYEDFLTSGYVWWQPGDRMMELNAGGAADQAKERWSYLRENIITDEWLLDEIDSLQSLVVDSGAMQRDEERWPEGNHDRSYEELKWYALERMAYLDEFMNDIVARLAE